MLLVQKEVIHRFEEQFLGQYEFIHRVIHHIHDIFGERIYFMVLVSK